MIYVKLALLLLLFLIVYQDFRFKAVSWIFFPIGFILDFIIAINQVGISVFLRHSSVITLFILFQLGIIYLFTNIRYKKQKKFFGRVLGIGDLLFFIMIVPLFSPLNYLVFFISSLIFTLIVFTVFFKLRVIKSYRIPLAGLQSMFLIFAMISQIICKFSFYNDFRILQYFIG